MNENMIEKIASNSIADAQKIIGLIAIEVKDRNGVVKERREIKNLITSAGKAGLAGLLCGDGSLSAFTYLAVGIGTTAANAADTTLESEITTSGLGRAAATISRVTTAVTNDTAQLVKSWAVTGTKAITEIGALNAASTGILLGRQVFAAVNVADGDTFQATYKFQISS